MSDRISLLGVRARGYHGVLADEKRDGQDFVVDVVLHLDLRPAGTSDDLTATVNYAEVGAEVVRRIEGPSLDLIEALAEQIAGDALERPGVHAVEVTVHKPSAPVGVPFGDVAVTITRRREVPVVIALLTWGVSSVVPGPAGDGAWLVVLGVIATPVILLLAGCVLMIPDRLRGWGVACLVAGGLWLISSAGVCTALVFGFAQMYQNDSSGVLL